MNATVIINTYNNPVHILQQAIESYVSQKNITNLQIIISTVAGDSSIALAKQYNLDLSVCPSPGIYKQLNYALQFIKNDWFCYASGNDVACDTKIYDEIQCCINNSKQICYSNFYITNEHLKIVKIKNCGPYDIKRHLKGNFVSDCSLIHKDIINQFTPFNYEQWGNHAYYDLWLRVYKARGNVFCYNDKPEWYYKLYDDSQHIKRQQNPAKQLINQNIKAQLIKYHENILSI